MDPTDYRRLFTCPICNFQSSYELMCEHAKCEGVIKVTNPNESLVKNYCCCAVCGHRDDNWLLLLDHVFEHTKQELEKAGVMSTMENM